MDAIAKLANFLIKGDSTRTVVALGSGFIFLTLVNFIYKIDLSTIPNWVEFGYVEKLVGIFVFSFFIGHVLLLIGWVWERLVKREIPVKNFKKFCEKGWTVWCSHFRDHGNSVPITLADIKDKINIHEITNFIQENSGLQSGLILKKQISYLARAIVGLTWFIFVDFVFGYSGLIEKTYLNFWIIYSILIFFTLESVSSTKFLQEYEVEIGKLLFKEIQTKKQTGG